MKKRLAATGLSLGLAFIIGGAAVMSSSGDSDEVNVELAIKEIEENNEITVTKEKIAQAAKDVGEVNEESTLVNKMIGLAIQKLQFEESEDFKIAGTPYYTRPQMTKENIMYLKERFAEIDTEDNYGNILDRWLKGDFDRIVQDYKEIRNIHTPDVDDSKVNVKERTEEREMEYISHFYGAEGLKKHNDQWE